MMNTKTNNTNIIVDNEMIVKVLEDQMMAAGAYMGLTQQLEIRDAIDASQYERAEKLLAVAWQAKYTCLANRLNGISATIDSELAADMKKILEASQSVPTQADWENGIQALYNICHSADPTKYSAEYVAADRAAALDGLRKCALQRLKTNKKLFVGRYKALAKQIQQSEKGALIALLSKMNLAIQQEEDPEGAAEAAAFAAAVKAVKASEAKIIGGGCKEKEGEKGKQNSKKKGVEAQAKQGIINQVKINNFGIDGNKEAINSEMVMAASASFATGHDYLSGRFNASVKKGDPKTYDGERAAIKKAARALCRIGCLKGDLYRFIRDFLASNMWLDPRAANKQEALLSIRSILAQKAAVADKVQLKKLPSSLRNKMSKATLGGKCGANIGALTVGVRTDSNGKGQKDVPVFEASSNLFGDNAVLRALAEQFGIIPKDCSILMTMKTPIYGDEHGHMNFNPKDTKPCSMPIPVNMGIDRLVALSFELPTDFKNPLRVQEAARRFKNNPICYMMGLKERINELGSRTVWTFVHIDKANRNVLAINDSGIVGDFAVIGLDGELYTSIGYRDGSRCAYNDGQPVDLLAAYNNGDCKVMVPLVNSTSGAHTQMSLYATINLGEGNIFDPIIPAKQAKSVVDIAKDINDIQNVITGRAIEFAVPAGESGEGAAMKMLSRLGLTVAANYNLGRCEQVVICHSTWNKMFQGKATVADAAADGTALLDRQLLTQMVAALGGLQFQSGTELHMAAQVRFCHGMAKAAAVTMCSDAVHSIIKNVIAAQGNDVDIVVLNGVAEIEEYQTAVRNGDRKQADWEFINYDETLKFTLDDVLSGKFRPVAAFDKNAQKLIGDYAKYPIELTVLAASGDVHQGRTNSQNLDIKATLMQEKAVKKLLKYTSQHFAANIKKALTAKEGGDLNVNVNYGPEAFYIKKILAVNTELAAKWLSNAFSTLAGQVERSQVVVPGGYFHMAVGPDLVMGWPILKAHEVYSGQVKKGKGRWVVIERNPSMGVTEIAVVYDLSRSEFIARAKKVAAAHGVSAWQLKAVLDTITNKPKGTLYINVFPWIHGLLGGHDYDWDGCTLYSDPEYVKIMRKYTRSTPVAWDECDDATETSTAHNTVDFRSKILELGVQYQLQEKLSGIMPIGIIAAKTAAIAAMGYYRNKSLFDKFLSVLLMAHPDAPKATDAPYVSVLSKTEVTQLSKALYAEALERFFGSDRSWDSWTLFLSDCTVFVAAIGGINLDAVKKQVAVDFYVLPEFMSNEPKAAKLRVRCGLPKAAPVAASFILKGFKLEASYDATMRQFKIKNKEEVEELIAKVEQKDNILIDFGFENKVQMYHQLMEAFSDASKLMNTAPSAPIAGLVGIPGLMDGMPMYTDINCYVSKAIFGLHRIDRYRAYMLQGDKQLVDNAMSSTIAWLSRFLANRQKYDQRSFVPHYTDEQAMQAIAMAGREAYTFNKGDDDEMTSVAFYNTFAPELFRIVDPREGMRCVAVRGFSEKVSSCRVFSKEGGVIGDNGEFGILAYAASLKKGVDYPVRNGHVLLDYGKRTVNDTFTLSVMMKDVAIVESRSPHYDKEHDIIAGFGYKKTAIEGRAIANELGNNATFLQAFWANLPTQLRKGGIKAQVFFRYTGKAVDERVGATKQYKYGTYLRLYTPGKTYDVRFNWMPMYNRIFQDMAEYVSSKTGKKVTTLNFDVLFNPTNDIALGLSKYKRKESISTELVLRLAY